MYSCNGAYEDTAYKPDQNLVKRSLRDNDTQPIKRIKVPAKASPFYSQYCCMLLALLLRVRHGKQTRPVRSIKAPVSLQLDPICIAFLAVVVVDAGGHPHRKRWLIRVYRYVHGDSQLMTFQECV